MDIKSSLVRRIVRPTTFCFLIGFYTEGVGQFEPRVELGNPGVKTVKAERYPERVGSLNEPL